MDTKSKPKEKRRNNEKRKEKSRNAARCRRSKETEIFSDISDCLPLAADQLSQLDRGSIMRLAISYIKVNEMTRMISNSLIDKKPNTVSLSNQPDETDFLQALNGFLMVLSMDGDIVYITENVHDYLGLNQVDLMGQSVFDYSHPCDQSEIHDTINSKCSDENDKTKEFVIRMKCTLTSKGRSVNLKSATYKVVQFVGHVIQQENMEEENKLKKCFIGVGSVIPHPSNIESPLPQKTFITKHSLDMKFTHADDKIMTQILGYDSEDLVGKSVYEFHHAVDSETINSSYKCLFAKGQCETGMYRFLAKHGGYVWVITQGTVINDKMNKPQSVVCVNYIISGVECKNEIYSAHQIPGNIIVSECNNNVGIFNEVPEVLVEEIGPLVEDVCPESPILCDKPFSVEPCLISDSGSDSGIEVEDTSRVFAPRTEDMNSGFVTFSDDEPGLTMLKEDPEDLTHLAPMIGDACEPLEDGPFLSDVLDEILFEENMLLGDPDPYLSYRNQYNLSPQLLSPNLSQGHDSISSSLNSPSGSLKDDDMLGLSVDDDSDQLMKSCMNTMNLDDLPLLITNDLMWNPSEKSTPVNVPDNSSSLAQLLNSSINRQNVKPKDNVGLLNGGSMTDTTYTNANNTTWSNLKPTKTPPELIRNTMETNKRPHNSTYGSSPPKRSKVECTDMSSELLAQLITNNQHRQSPKGKTNWLLNSGSKAACISQPSDSVLMNLLVTQESPPVLVAADSKRLVYVQVVVDKGQIQGSPIQPTLLQTVPIRRRRSSRLLNTDAIPSLMDLTQHDYDVNAPTGALLQGKELINALEVGTPI